MPANRRFSRRLAVVSVGLAAASVGVFAAATASADDAKCPPGSWFCAEADIKIGVGVEAGTTTPPAATTELTPTPPPTAPPPVVIYTPPPAPPPPVYRPAPVYVQPYIPAPRYSSEIGVNVHLGGGLLGGNDGHSGATMGGIGGSLRFRPNPWFAVDLGIDFVGGTDANGLSRTEMPLTALGLLYLNPRSPVQLYLLGGFGFSAAAVHRTDGLTDHYSYFGGLFGGGVEFRIAKKTALNFDLRGFVRERTDDQASVTPEFTARDGRTTNTSGGALVTGGITFYF